jgi:hypothetical protein
MRLRAKSFLFQIIEWVEVSGDEHSAARKQILWLQGPAGAGKSAIAQTISEVFRQKNIVAATFFFSRGTSPRGNGKSFVSTISYQLAPIFPGLCHYIGSVVAHDPSILRRYLRINSESSLSNRLPRSRLHPSLHHLIPSLSS